EAGVEVGQGEEPGLVRRSERAHAVRLRPVDLCALDRARDAPAARGSRDGEEAVPPDVVLDAEEAVAERAVVFERDEVRVGRMRIEPPRAPLVEALDALLRSPGLVAVRLARDLEDGARYLGA